MKKLILICATFLFFSHHLFAISDTLRADFSWQISEQLHKPSIIKFTNLSQGAFTSIVWEFGDGSTSTETNPLHYFPANGEFEVRLIISDGLISDETTQTLSINVTLNLDFTFKLDSNNVVPNTFLFSAQIEGPYDQLTWKFGEEVIADVKDTIHSYALEDHDYQVTVSANYFYNDTSRLVKTIAKGLTTARYMDLGGQIYFGDSLMNNPYPTGDTGLAILYRIDYDELIPIDTNEFTELGYYWFYQKLKAHYLVRVGFTESSQHYGQYATTYSGNTTQWDEAQIINLAQDKYREDIAMVENLNKKTGTSIFKGHISELIPDLYPPDQPFVYLYNTENQLISFTQADDNGDFRYENLENGHYILRADFTGLASRSKLLHIDYNRLDTKSAEIETSAEIFPNPTTDYSILQYENLDDLREISIQFYQSTGQFVGEKKYALHSLSEYLHIDFSEMPKGLLLVKIMDSRGTTLKIVHQ